MSKQLIVRVVLAMGLVLVAGVALRSVAADEKESGKVLHHVVSFKFSDTATPELIKAVEDGFAALPGKIAEVKNLRWGTNVSTENLNKGFTHCFLSEFASEADLQVYLKHPAHVEFVKILRPAMADAFVIDFWEK